MTLRPNLLVLLAPAMVITLSVGLFSPAARAEHHKDAEAAETKDEKDGKDAEAAAEKDSKEKKPAVTRGTVKLRSGADFEYRAEAGEITLRENDGKPSARVFYVAYVADYPDGEKPDAARPVTFCFNGGPGSCAVWLHLGGLGPHRIAIPNKGTGYPSPPYALTPNPDTLLANSDVVFIDPVSTGYSRPEEEKDAKNFHGINEDVESVGDFIRRYVTEHHRWSSPKYLLGESYGAVRACGLAEHLQDRYGMYLNGVCLLSGLIDYQAVMDRGGNDLPYVTFLPALAATAAWHGRANVGMPHEDLDDQVRDFATGAYSQALHLGDRISDQQRQAVAEELSKFTSISTQRILEADLRISPSFFRKELLRSEEKVLGRYDARVVGPAISPLDATPWIDPSYDNVYGAFASTINAYLSDELGFESENGRPYEILTRKVHPWNYKPFENRYASVAPRLRGAMVQNPHLKVLVLCGRYDLATPAGAMEYSIAQLDLPEDRRELIDFAYYEGGHMMYTNPEAMKQLGTDLGRWIGPPPAAKDPEQGPAKPKPAPKSEPKPEQEQEPKTKPDPKKRPNKA